MTDWTPQDDWSRVKVGDTVRAMRAQQMLTGVVVDRYITDCTDVPYGLLVELINTDEMVEVKVSNGWQLSVPAKPAVVLPDEPGAVIMWVDSRGYRWYSRLGDSGKWFIDRAEYWENDLLEEIKDSVVVVLEPVAVTAKKVLHFFEHDMSDDVFEAARKEFGVTE